MKEGGRRGSVDANVAEPTGTLHETSSGPLVYATLKSGGNRGRAQAKFFEEKRKNISASVHFSYLYTHTSRQCLKGYVSVLLAALLAPTLASQLTLMFADVLKTFSLFHFLVQLFLPPHGTPACLLGA